MSSCPLFQVNLTHHRSRRLTTTIPLPCVLNAWESVKRKKTALRVNCFNQTMKCCNKGTTDVYCFVYMSNTRIPTVEITAWHGVPSGKASIGTIELPVNEVIRQSQPFVNQFSLISPEYMESTQPSGSTPSEATAKPLTGLRECLPVCQASAGSSAATTLASHWRFSAHRSASSSSSGRPLVVPREFAQA